MTNLVCKLVNNIREVDVKMQFIWSCNEGCIASLHLYSGIFITSFHMTLIQGQVKEEAEKIVEHD